MEVRYEVRAFYTTGGMAFRTWNKGELSRDMEIAAAMRREDIGRVEWRVANGPWSVAPAREK